VPTTLTATPEPGNEPPRIKLELTWTGKDYASIMRRDPDGQVRPVRQADWIELSAGIAPVVYDYESWFNSATTYEALAGGDSISSSPVSLNIEAVWLRHPGVPSLSIAPDFAGDGDAEYAANRAVLRPLGGRYPIVVTDGVRKANSSVMKLRTATLAERQAVLDLFADCPVLLLDVPPAWGWGIEHEYRACGDLTEVRMDPDKGPEPSRLWSAQFDVVDWPAGGQVSQRTYADVLTEAATYTELHSHYASYADLLAGVRIGS
jgi:hypothetical protein